MVKYINMILGFNIVAKLKKSGLTGRSGSGFSTALKWQIVKGTKAKKKYIIANGAEGEPGSFKDEFVLKNHGNRVVEAIEIAMKTIKAERGYLYLKKDYFEKFGEKLKGSIGEKPIALFQKPGGYLAGEETSVCEAIEGKTPEPRIKPPFPTQSGLWGYPTLINNVETFFRISQISRGEYENKRFYSLSGDIKRKGVYDLPENWTIKRILKETGNLPDFDFFVQAGGGAIGEILLPDELNRSVGGIGALIVFNREKTNIQSLMKKWADFFLAENCDKCVPCREGVFRISEMINRGVIDPEIFKELALALTETSFCPLGRSLVVPFASALKKLSQHG